MVHSQPQRDANCKDITKRIDEAATQLGQKTEELSDLNRQVRHGARNIQMLAQAALSRLERKNHEP